MNKKLSVISENIPSDKVKNQQKINIFIDFECISNPYYWGIYHSVEKQLRWLLPKKQIPISFVIGNLKTNFYRHVISNFPIDKKYRKNFFKLLLREIKEVAGTKNLKRITFWAYQKLMEEEVLNYLLYEKVEVMEIKDKFPSPKIPKMCDLTEMTQKIIENQEIFKSIKPKILIKRQGALICYLCFLLTVKRYPEIVSKEKFLNQIIDINEDIIIKNLEKYSESEIEFIKNNIVASDWK